MLLLMQNSIHKVFFISVLGLGGVVFDSAPPKETLFEIGGGNFFTA
jgi:hypothetical protein